MHLFLAVAVFFLPLTAQGNCDSVNEICDRSEKVCVPNLECTAPLITLAGKAISRQYKIKFRRPHWIWLKSSEEIQIIYTYKLSEECGNKVIVTRYKNVPYTPQEGEIDRRTRKECTVSKVYSGVEAYMDTAAREWKVKLPNVFFFLDKELTGYGSPHNETDTFAVSADDFTRGTRFKVKDFKFKGLDDDDEYNEAITCHKFLYN